MQIREIDQLRLYFFRQGVINVVKKAKYTNGRVRASGLKHSWNHWVWGVDNKYETVDNPCYYSWEDGDVDYFIAMA